MRRAVLACLAACSFSPPTGGAAGDDSGGAPDDDGGAIPSDGGNESDDSGNTGPSCAVSVASTTGMNRGNVGGAGGGDYTMLACDSPAERIVGVTLRMSNNNTSNGGRSAHGISIACATTAVDANGATVGAIAPHEVSGTGGTQGTWLPSTWTELAQCPAGALVSGLRVHQGPNSNLFTNASITCSAIAVTGMTGAVTEHAIPDASTEAAGEDQGACDPGEVLVRVGARHGAGIDSLDLYCSPSRCE